MYKKLEESRLFPIMALGLLGISTVVMWLLVRSPFLPLALVPVILAGLHYYGTLSTRMRRFYVGFLLVVILIFSGHMVRTMRGGVNGPPEFDFKSFWLNGKIGLQRVNFYEPEHFYREAEPLNPTPFFKDQILDTAFWYPPFSIFLFLPLGLFDVPTALALWYVFLTVLLVVDIWLIWRTFLPDSGRIGLGVSAALMLVIHPTWAMYFYGQTDFLLLLFLIMFWREREHPRAGLWLALAVVVKLFAVFLLPFLLFQKRWRGIVVMGISLAVISGITILVYGTETFFSYNPIGSKFPPSIYIEWVNQGLLATVLRLTNFEFGGQSPLTQPIFVIVGGLIGLVTLWFVSRLPKSEGGWAISLLMILALLLYPPSLMHYTMIMIFPMLLMWNERQELPGGMWGVIGFITLIFVLIGIGEGINSFEASTIFWFVLVGICARKLGYLTARRPQLTSVQSASS